MLDLKFVVENADAVRRNAERKGEPCDVDRILELDGQRRERIARVEALQANVNKLSKGMGPVIGMLKKGGGKAADADRDKIAAALDRAVDRTAEPELHAKLAAAIDAGADKLQAELKGLRESVNQGEADRKQVEEQLDAELARLPNMLHETVPDGKSADDNVEVATGGEKPTFEFTPKPHYELCGEEGLGLLQMETGAKLAGSAFYALRGDLARLEWALLSFCLDRAAKAGYTPWMVPVVCNEPTMYGTGYLPKMRDQVYHMDERDPGFFLIPTAEAPLTSIHAGEMLAADDLPKHYCAWSACFRREAGAAGRDTRGLLRVHQFNKVELFKLVHPDTGYAEHAKLRETAEALLTELGLHYRVLELCAGDMSFSAAKCWDIEAWSPGANEWLEVSSVSNFEDFQTRRVNIRFREPDAKKPRFAHTINGSGLPTPRVLVAIIETYQQADGTIRVPKPLQPFMGGTTVIGG